MSIHFHPSLIRSTPRRRQELSAPRQGIVVSSEVGINVIFVLGFGKPNKGRCGVSVGARVGELLAKAAVNQPRAKRGAVGKGMFTNFEAGGKEYRDRAENTQGSFEKAACVKNNKEV